MSPRQYVVARAGQIFSTVLDVKLYVQNRLLLKMRDLLAAVSDTAESSAGLLLFTLVAVFVSVGILTPTVAICVACFGKKACEVQHEPQEDRSVAPRTVAITGAEQQVPPQIRTPQPFVGMCQRPSQNGGEQQSQPPQVPQQLPVEPCSAAPTVHPHQVPSTNSTVSSSGILIGVSAVVNGCGKASLAPPSALLVEA